MSTDRLEAARADALRRQRFCDAFAALVLALLAGAVFWFVPPSA
jgi:hypothetical protein